jgi:hypothetical protein
MFFGLLTLARLRSGRLSVVLAVATVTGLSGVCVSSAGAAWGPTVDIASVGQPGGDGQPGSGAQPFVAVSPSGGVGLAFQGADGATYLVRRSIGGPFSAPQPVTAPGSSVLEGLALPDPAAVLLFQNNDGSSDARIQSSASGPLNAPQQLIGATEPDLSAGAANLLTTTLGDVIASTFDDRGDAGAAALPYGAGQFSNSAQVNGNAECGGGSNTPALAADDAGGAFVATGAGDCSRVSVFYRPRAGTFGTGRPVGFKPLNSFGLGAGGHGTAALAEVYGGFRPGHVEIQVGHADRFGRSYPLARTPYVANTQLFGPVVGRTGNVTVAWEACGSRDLGCSVAAARGNVNGRFGRPHTLAVVPRRDGPNAGVQPAIGPGTIALQSCRSLSQPCSISVVFAGRAYGFTRPQRLTDDGQLDQLASDRAGDEVLVWTASDGSLWVAERAAGRSHFGPPHQLAPAGTQPQADNISAAFSEHAEALIAWQSQAGDIAGATYAINTPAG